MRPTLTLLPLLLCSIFLLRTIKLVTKLSNSPHQTHYSKDFSISFNNGCNLFQGKWLLEEPSSRPLYTEQSCPYLTRQVTCRKNGRPDSVFQKWRWKPYGCNLPRFDALMLLQILRNKRLMFVGDSIQRTQWESMVCLLQSAVPAQIKMYCIWIIILWKAAGLPTQRISHIKKSLNNTSHLVTEKQKLVTKPRK